MQTFDLTNVSQKQVNCYRIDIYFMVNNQSYFLTVRLDQMENVFKTDIVVHVSFGNSNTCFYCNHEKPICSYLNVYSEELFYRLIEFPRIRLEWLFIPYKRKVMTHDASHD